MTDSFDRESDALEAVRTGDATAFGPIWDAYHARLASYIRRHSPYLDAEDAASQVLESTLSATLHGLGPTQSIWSYLVQSARCEIARQAAAERCRRPLPEEIEPDDAPVSSEASDLLRDVVLSFPEQDRIVIVGAMAERRKTGAIAQELGRDPAWVSRRVHKLRPKLQQRWIQAHIDAAGAPEQCRKMLAAAGRVLSGQSTERSTLQFWLHVDACEFCRPRVDDAQEASRRLGIVLPILATPGLLKLMPAEGGSSVVSPNATLKPDAPDHDVSDGRASEVPATANTSRGTLRRAGHGRSGLSSKGVLVAIGGITAAGAMVMVLLGSNGMGPLTPGPDTRGGAPNAVQGPGSGGSKARGSADGSDDSSGRDSAGNDPAKNQPAESASGESRPGSSRPESPQRSSHGPSGTQNVPGGQEPSNPSDTRGAAPKNESAPGGEETNSSSTSSGAEDNSPATSETSVPVATPGTKPCSWAPQLQCETANG